MNEILLINPAKRGAKRKKVNLSTRKGNAVMAKTRRTAAQRAATARMIAANKARRKGATGKARTTHVMVANPAPRRRRRSPVKAHTSIKRTRRYKRNPISGNSIKGMLEMGLKGALGATAVNTIHNYLAPYLPASVQGGNMGYIVRGALAVALGSFGGKLMSRPLAQQMAMGSLTVTLHDAIRDNFGAIVPGVTLGYTSPGMTTFPQSAPRASLPNKSGMGMYAPAGLGMYAPQGVKI